jgi:hypothetical protein
MGESYPHKGPFQDMSPAGFPGLLVILAAVVCVWSLFPVLFWPVVAVISVISVALALVLRGWRNRHPTERYPLHLDSGASNHKNVNL